MAASRRYGYPEAACLRPGRLGAADREPRHALRLAATEERTSAPSRTSRSPESRLRRRRRGLPRRHRLRLPRRTSPDPRADRDARLRPHAGNVVRRWRSLELRRGGAVEDGARRSLGRAREAARRLRATARRRSARATASALSSPATRKRSSRVSQRRGSVIEIRSTNGSWPASEPTTSRSVTSSVGKFGKSDATWPSGPRPSRTRSNVPTSVELELVLGRALVAAELALHAVDGCGLPLEPVEQRRLRHARSSSARRRAARSARLPTRARRGSSRARARRRARTRGAASSRR